ncbi:MAG: Wzz/FepE/Etk N-terminal domain-containing protein [Thermoleophilia bacterium]
MTTPTTDGFSLHDYLAILRRWKWLVVATTLVVALAGWAYLHTRTPMYSATAQLLYTQQTNIGSPLSQSFVDQTQQQADIGSVPAVLASGQVGGAAAQLLGARDQATGYSVSGVLQTDSSGSNYLNVVGIQAASKNPAAAADAANAYAQAFIAWRRDSARARVTQAIQAVQSSLGAYTTPASQKSADYLAFQQQLQDLKLLQASVTGDFSVISPASAPSTPYSPRKTRGLAEAIILGLVLGIGLAFLVEQLDTRVRDEEQISDALGLTVLGHIPPLTRSSGEGGALRMLVDPTGPSAEAVRVLRGNLDFMGVDGDLRSLVVSSSVQSEGKSVVACNLAVSMALAGKRVVLVDADLRRPRVHTYVGVPNGVGLSSVIARHAALDDALISLPLRSGGQQSIPGATAQPSLMKTSTSAGSRAGRVTVADAGEGIQWMDDVADSPELRVLPSGPLPPNPGEMVASRRFAEIIDKLAADADLVLVDAPAMLAVGDLAAIAAKVDALVYVVNPTQLKRPILHQAHSQLAKLPCRKLGLVVISRKRQHSYYGYYRHPSQETHSELTRV